MHLTVFTLSLILGAANALPGHGTGGPYSSPSGPPVTYTVTAVTPYSSPTYSSHPHPPYTSSMGGDCGPECGGTCMNPSFLMSFIPLLHLATETWFSSVYSRQAEEFLYVPRTLSRKILKCAMLILSLFRRRWYSSGSTGTVRPRAET
jgi:hypothetical protein